jgi:malonyl CoA-acyl carrier protein transacylase
MSQVLSPIVAGAGLSFGVLLVLAVSNGVAQLLFNETVEGFVSKRVGA